MSNIVMLADILPAQMVISSLSGSPVIGGSRSTVCGGGFLPGVESIQEKKEEEQEKGMNSR